MGWHELEEAVRRARYDPEKAREAAQEKFRAAVKSLKKSGAEGIMRTIAKLVPELKLKTVYDFDEAGGTGFSPSIKLIEPDKTGEREEYLQRIGYVSSISHRTLSVSSLIHLQGLISIDIWESQILTDKYDKKTSAGHHVWDNNRWDYQDPKMLAESIFLGLHGLISPEDKRLATVRKALRLPERRITPALLPRIE